MKKIYVKIDGMHCSHCENTIREILLTIPNIRSVEFDGYIASITYTGKINKEEIKRVIIDKDYITKDEYISENVDDLKDNIKLKEFLLISLVIILIVFLVYKIFGFNIFNVIPTIDNNITYGMLFMTGLLTSIHCISMCGAINLTAVLDISVRRNIKRPILYNLGRLISYTLLGGMVGLLGSVFQVNNTISGIIIIIASILMLTMSLNMLGILKIKRFNIIKYKTKSRNPFIIGILNGLMPCGPLQAMQVYALSTGSFIQGALSLFLFGLGTVPLMLFAGIILSIVKGKSKIIINKVASILILLLSIMMLNRGLLSLNIDILKNFNDYDKFTISTLKDKKDNYQVIEFDLKYDNYEDIIIQKDIPVKMIINVDKKYLTGCNNEIIIKEYGIKQELKEGQNIIEFTPTKEETITYTCWMNMIKNRIKVVDDKKYFKGDE